VEHRRRALIASALLAATLCVVVAAACNERPPDARPEVRADLSDAEPGVRAAIERALECVPAAPADASTWGTLGAVLAAHSFTEDARVAFAHAARLDPRSARWLHLCASTTEGDPAARVALLRRAVAEDPQDAAIGAFLAESLAELGDRNAARAQFERVLGLHGARDPRALAGLARIELDEGNASAARDLLFESSATFDRADSRRSLAAALELAGDSRGAAREARSANALEQDEPWPDAHVAYVATHAVGPSALARRIRLVLRSDGPGAALPTARLAIRSYPENGILHTLLGQCLLELGNAAEAESALRDALRAGHDSADTHWLLARSLAVRRLTAEAIVESRRALELHPAHARAALLLGRCLYQSGERAAAIEELERASERGGADAALHGLLGALLAEDGRLDTALIHARAAAELAPRDSSAAALVSGILRRLESR
jgi:Flp pilus assembly protein TadD